MVKDKAKKQVIQEMQARGLELANGCTEPAAIAYAAASAAKHLDGEPSSIILKLSSNMMKNAVGVGVPDSKYRGLEFAAAMGALYADSDKKLQLLSGISSDKQDKAYNFATSGAVKVVKTDGVDNLYIDVLLKNENGTARAVIVRDHLNLVLLEENGKVLFYIPVQEEKAGAVKPIADQIDVSDIVDYVESADFDASMFKKAAELNMQVSKDGLEHNRGFNISGLDLGDSVLSQAVKATSAAVVSRMSGADKPVVANSGSGNQGLTATVPVVTMAKQMGLDENTTIKAVAISNYVAMYIKQNMNTLSHLCGAVTASAGAAAGMTYLKGGNATQIEHAAGNVLASLTGMFCDGAKETCALKVASGVSMAVVASEMAMLNDYANNIGISRDSLSKTVKGIAKLEKATSQKTNEAVFSAVFPNYNTK